MLPTATQSVRELTHNRQSNAIPCKSPDVLLRHGDRHSPSAISVCRLHSHPPANRPFRHHGFLLLFQLPVFETLTAYAEVNGAAAFIISPVTANEGNPVKSNTSPLLLCGFLVCVAGFWYATQQGTPARAQDAAAQHPNWEYLVLPQPPGAAPERFAASINELGYQGWELVCVIPLHSDGSTVRTMFYFKRPRE